MNQDYRLKQPRKTLAFAKALQFWVEEAQPTWVNKPCQLAACVRELREAMEPLTTFMDEDILVNDPPSPWKKIMHLQEVPKRGKRRPKKLQGHGAGVKYREPIPEVPFGPTLFWDVPGPSASL